MDPVSLAAVSIGASAAGAGVSAFGSIFKGNADASMYNYKAGVAQVNAQIAKQNADFATFVGEEKAQQEGMKTRAQIGETKATQGAGNLDVNSGSNLAVRQSEQEIGEYSQAVIRSNAAKQAYGYQIEALGDTEEAKLDTYAASESKQAGTIGAISSILGGVSSVSSKWSSAKQSGIFS